MKTKEKITQLLRSISRILDVILIVSFKKAKFLLLHKLYNNTCLYQNHYRLIIFLSEPSYIEANTYK